MGIDNSGTITADGGQVLISAQIAGDLLKTVINNTGVIQARTIENHNGTIKLLGGMENNAINVGGTLDASAPNIPSPLAGEGQGEGYNGGFIETSAAKVNIADDAVITTYAPYGKTGTWLIDPNDYTIAASGGDITGAALGTNLGTNNITILSSDGATGTNGDIFVNDAVNWSANTLNLTAERNVEINAVMTATSTAGLEMNTGAGGAVNVGFNTDGSFKGRVDPAAGTWLTINSNVYTIINSLGAGGSTTGTDLQGMSGSLAGRYALGSNIDATTTSSWNAGAGFAPVGNNILPFEGIFDGLGHTITGLTINRPATTYVGLFGRTSYGSIISNVGLLDVNITGNYYVGGLVRENGGTITNSYATGTVDGGSGDNVGGLVGYNYGGTIDNSYSTGSVSGRYYVGGLVGLNNDTITDSYWDTETSGRANCVGLGSDSGCTGLTTAQMKQQANFSNWDFTDIWRIYEGDTYPLLKSFLTPLTVTATSGSRVYDGTTDGIGVSYSLTPDMTKVLGTLVYTGAVKDVGDYTITPGGYYSIQQGYDISYANGALTVTPAALTVTANADSKTYDGLAYTGGNGVTYTGLVNSETSAVLGGALAYGGTLQGAINADGYVITPSGQTSGNYTITYVDGVLTITAAPSIITSAPGTTTTTASYTDVIQEWLRSGSAAQAAEQPAKFEVAYASADSPVFTFTETGRRPLITDYRSSERDAGHRCLIVKKDVNPIIVEADCK